jgi:hypothetical protein
LAKDTESVGRSFSRNKQISKCKYQKNKATSNPSQTKNNVDFSLYVKVGYNSINNAFHLDQIFLMFYINQATIHVLFDIILMFVTSICTLISGSPNIIEIGLRINTLDNIPGIIDHMTPAKGHGYYTNAKEKLTS